MTPADQARFDALWRRVGARNSSTAAFSALTEHYSEPHRRYHTDCHIIDCLDTYDSSTHILGSIDAVEMALWFHDVIYEIGQANNEVHSAELFRSFSNSDLPTEFIEQVVRLIMATRHHALAVETDEQFITDVDLDGLAKPWDSFINDTQLLRQENSLMDDKTFQTGVDSFLSRLMKRPTIYSTSFFQTKSEAGARNNIERLLSELDSLKLRP